MSRIHVRPEPPTVSDRAGLIVAALLLAGVLALLLWWPQ